MSVYGTGSGKIGLILEALLFNELLTHTQNVTKIIGGTQHRTYENWALDPTKNSLNPDPGFINFGSESRLHKNTNQIYPNKIKDFNI